MNTAKEVSNVGINSWCTSLIGPFMSIAYRFMSPIVVVVGLFTAIDVFRFLFRLLEDMIFIAGYDFVASASAIIPMMRLFKK